MPGGERVLRLGAIGCGELTQFKHLPALASIPAFNAANHANLNAPVNTLSNPNFGQIDG